MKTGNRPWLDRPLSGGDTLFDAFFFELFACCVFFGFTCGLAMAFKFNASIPNALIAGLLGIAALLGPLLLVYGVIWLCLNFKTIISMPWRLISLIRRSIAVKRSMGASNILAFFSRLGTRSITLLICAALIAIAIIVFAFVHRSPRYVPVGRDGAILDTHTGKTSHWMDAPNIFPYSN